MGATAPIQWIFQPRFQSTEKAKHMTTSIRFAFDAATLTAMPELDSGTVGTGESLAIPDVGDSVTFAAAAGHAFVVDERHYAYDGSGSVTVTIKVTLASERSI